MSGKKKHGEKGNQDRKLWDSAEDRLARRSDSAVTLAGKHPEDLIHELRVHQIELEMQNEELRRTQGELEAVRARYSDLYDLAPVGYCTFSEQGLILEANLAAATLLGVVRGALVKQPFSRFILNENQDVYYRHRKQLFESGEPQAFDLRMEKQNGTVFWAHLTAAAVLDPATNSGQAADGAPVCLVVLNDITERKFREDDLDLTTRLIVLINTPGDFREPISALIASMKNWSGCEAAGIRLGTGAHYPYYETCGFPPAFVQQEDDLCAYGPDGKILCDGKGNPVLECICGNILCGRFDPAKPFFTDHGSFWSNNTATLLAATAETDRRACTRNRCYGEGYASVALIPLRAGDQVFGLLQFNDHHPDRFTPGLIAHFERMADSLAIALSRRQVEKELQHTLESLRKAVHATIKVMVSAVDARDPYTAGHQIRSANLARAIATEMGLPPEKVDAVRMAGSIHDIGKLSIPAEILSKPTKLTEIEFALVKEHASKGFEMLKDVESPWLLAEIIYQHHERMDGSGYPRNLKGDEILTGARILSVSDVVEAMTSHRPYRPSLGIDAALKEIESHRGVLYDVDVVDACLTLFREKGFCLDNSLFESERANASSKTLTPPPNSEYLRTRVKEVEGERAALSQFVANSGLYDPLSSMPRSLLKIGGI